MTDSEPQRTILVAVDDTEASELALQWAIDNLLRPGDKVHLTHVAQLPWGGIGRIISVDALPPFCSEQTEDREFTDTMILAKHMMNKRFAPRVKNIQHKMEIVHYNKSTAEVGEVICERANDLQADAVVMASHNKGAMQRLFLGSATTYCTKHCPVSLVITR